MKPMDKSKIQKAKKQSTDSTAEQPGETDSAVQKIHFPIIGIGASAGGLEALESFLSNVPTDSGMAFVIVQHLDPTHKGILVELLQRATPMPVRQVTDRMGLQPDCVYVIPPNKDLSILHGNLHLLDPSAPRGLRLPIDFFFSSLAADQQERSIGVILSGMGSDGTLGLRAIKEKAGVTFVQDPASAKFDGMPHSAIKARLADVIAPVEVLPGKIVAYLRHTLLIASPDIPGTRLTQGALEKVAILLRSHTGHDFSMYKNTTIARRIERRMGLHQIDRVANYLRYLLENPQEVELLFHELLIGVTSFFRDPESWEQLKADILPGLLTGSDASQNLRAWVTACSTGEEAYSLAMLFQETMDDIVPTRNFSLQIFATDLDAQAIEKAREGLFPPNIAADVSAQRLDRFFIKTERGYQITKSIREMVIFATQNVIMDPPFTKLDFVSCRNLLIYLMPELQKKILPLFHYSLNPGGFLFLGSAETIGSFTNLFTPLKGKKGLYQRRASDLSVEPVEFPTAFTKTRDGAPTRVMDAPVNLQTMVEQLLLRKYTPASVLTNDRGDILYTSGRTGKYLEPAVGKANWNIFAMLREGLRYELPDAFQKALREKQTITVKNQALSTESSNQLVNVSIEPVSGPGASPSMVLIVFVEGEAQPKAKATGRRRPSSARTDELEQELEYARKEVQHIREEMQSSQEELRSTNEELQSTNEELQSTNEELTTSKEELQSMNEELHTVNQELQIRLDELAHTNNDMKNLLDSTDIATLFLDNELRVRRFTSETSKVTHLIPADAGRPITDIASALLYPDLADDARQVLQTLVTIERQIPTPDKNWYSVRILPYRTLDNMIDGVVITFSDITVYKTLEAELRRNTGEQQ